MSVEIGSSNPRKEIAPITWCAVAVLALHGPSIEYAGFNGDDPAHIAFALKNSIGGMFTDREVMLDQSYAHLTPMLGVLMKASLGLVGLDATRLYALLLIPILGTAYLTWLLLRQWVSSAAAGSAIFLWLCLPSVSGMLGMLATIHYSWGLLFLVAAIFSFGKATTNGSWAWVVAASVLYALACWCKELYVPAILVFWAWPSLAWSQRWRLVIPLGFVALCYTITRLWLFDGVGGYAALHAQQPLWDPLRSLKTVITATFGEGKDAAAAATILLALLIARVLHTRPRVSVPFLVASVACLLGPIAPVLVSQSDTPYGTSRLMVLIGWAIVFLVAWSADRSPIRVVLIVGAALLTLLSTTRMATEVQTHQARIKAEHRYLLSNTHDAPPLASLRSFNIGYLEAMRESRRLHSHVASPDLISRVEELADIGTAATKVNAWNEQCRCIEPLGERALTLVSDEKEAILVGRDKPLSVRFESTPFGSRRFSVTWNFQAQDDAQWSIEIQGLGELPATSQGMRAAGRDATFNLPEPINVRVRMLSVHDGLIYSDWLRLSLHTPSEATWTR